MTTTDLTSAITEALGDLDRFSHQCHAASLALVKSRVLEDFRFEHPGRVARGTCKGVGGQHSWVVIGEDVYDQTAIIVDLTLWSYGATEDRVWVGNMIEDGLHRPHGSNSIWQAGCPQPGDGDPLLLPGLSPLALDFLDMIEKTTGPLDRVGWVRLFSSNAMIGWPAGEILTALVKYHPDVAAALPIDIIGMLTDTNPSGLYLAG